MASSTLQDLDPTGTLSAVGAGVSLVGAALRLGTAAKKFQDARHPNSGGLGGSGPAAGGGGGGGGGGDSGGGAGPGPAHLHRSQTSPNEVPVASKDLERERRAYETVNFVLREFGSRICAAGMVDEHALTKALTAATQHIEVNLFSGETNRLFESLAPKLGDPILVNSVFTSIYFIGALTAELSGSLPNYKDAYVPVGPRLVQQLFRAAIGEDAFRDNLTANLDAYKTLTTTAGLLRPTDIGYLTFPRFPSFAPSKYSSRSLTDVHRNRSTYEKLLKHFERAGFPQPTPGRQAEVGLIRDWKFLSGESNSRAFDVDKADRNIGENFGRVVYWLICSAERLPPGQAVIAYYEQHIELIKWIQHRMGYAVLYPAIDLNFAGPHGQLDRKLRATIDSWVILMPSGAAQAAKRANAEHWMTTHLKNVAQAPPFVAPTTATTRLPSMATLQEHYGPPPAAPLPPPVRRTPSVVTHSNSPATQAVSPVAAQGPPPMRHSSQASSHSHSVASVPLSTNETSTTEPTSPPMPSTSLQPNNLLTTSSTLVELPTLRDVQPALKTFEQQVDEIHQHFRNALVPQFQRLWSQPSADPGIRDSQCNVLAHTIERETIDRLDRINISEGHSVARMHRKSLIDQAQELLDFLPVYKDLGPSATHGRPLPGALLAHVQQSAAVDVPQRPPTQVSQSTGSSPPPYTPASPPSTGFVADMAAPHPIGKPKPTAIRRKAPPPPRKFIPAKALYDFEPDPDNEEELGFKEDDEIEIIEKNSAMEEDGWCRARIKGSKRIGLVPLEYLEVVEKQPALGTALSKPPSLQDGPPQTLAFQDTTLSHVTIPDVTASPSHDAASVWHTPPPHVTLAPHDISQLGVAHAPAPAQANATIPPSKPPAHQQPAMPINTSSAYQQTVVNVSQPMQHGGDQAVPATSQLMPSKSHVSKFEAAALANAALGAVTHVGAVVEGRCDHGSGPGEGSPADGRRQEQFSLNTGEQMNVGNPSDVRGGGSHNAIGDCNDDNGNYQSTADDQIVASGVSNRNEEQNEQEPLPTVDLSAFGVAPLEPQALAAGSFLPTTFESDRYYGPQAISRQQMTEADPVGTSITNYGGTSAVTGVIQDTSSTTFVDGSATMVSPFAFLASNSTDTTVYTESSSNNADGTTSTYDSFTEERTSISMDLNYENVTETTDQTLDEY